MNQITTKRATRASGRRILGNVVGRRKETCVRPRRADFQRLAREHVTARSPMSLVNLRQQRRVDANVAQVRKRTNRHSQTRQTGRDRLYRQTLVEIFAVESEGA